MAKSCLTGRIIAHHSRRPLSGTTHSGLQLLIIHIRILIVVIFVNDGLPVQGFMLGYEACIVLKDGSLSEN